MFLFTSCEKEDIAENPAHEEQRKTNSYSSLEGVALLPSENPDQIMRFETVEEFKNFYNSMSDLYDEDLESFASRLESECISNSVYNKLHNDRFENSDDRFQPFVNDPIMRAIINENYEFQVENILFTYINDEILLTSDIKDLETQNAIRKMKKGGKLTRSLIPHKAYPVFDHDFETIMNPWKDSKKYSKNQILDQYVNEYENSMRNNCDKDEHSTGWGWAQNSNGTKGVSHHTVIYYSWQKTYEASEAYSKDKFGSVWVPVNTTYLVVRVQAFRRDDQCISPYNGYVERSLCYNCNYQYARVKCWGKKYHSPGDVTSYVHRKVGGGIIANNQAVVW